MAVSIKPQVWFTLKDAVCEVLRTGFACFALLKAVETPAGHGVYYSHTAKVVAQSLHVIMLLIYLFSLLYQSDWCQPLVLRLPPALAI